MADHVRIEGVPPYDGEHPLDVGTFTQRELHTIKTVAGVRANEIEEAGLAGDTDLVVAFAVIALERAGHRVDVDLLWNAELGKITLDLSGDGETDAGPPDPAPSESGSPESAGAKNGSSGSPLNGTGDLPGSVPSPTGVRGSEAGFPSDRETSAI